MSVEKTAAELLRCALAHERGARLIGNLTALDLARLACSRLTACPACGADPGANIDCEICIVISGLEAEAERGGEVVS